MIKWGKRVIFKKGLRGNGERGKECSSGEQHKRTEHGREKATEKKAAILQR